VVQIPEGARDFSLFSSVRPGAGGPHSVVSIQHPVVEGLISDGKAVGALILPRTSNE